MVVNVLGNLFNTDNIQYIEPIERGLFNYHWVFKVVFKNQESLEIGLYSQDVTGGKTQSDVDYMIAELERIRTEIATAWQTPPPPPPIKVISAIRKATPVTG